ncbi:MAG TPA: sulfotransferase domain-containing protein [Thermomicrobiales bacterium]
MAASRRSPNFLFIGPDKSGSTWLYEVLKWHPQVFVSRAKELFYFDHYFHLGEDWYLAHFGGATPGHRAVGEISHDYLFSVEAADRIKRLLPGVKLIACPREPVERAHSSYLYMRKQGRVRCGFEEAIQTVDELVDHGLYAKHLRPYYERFGREAVYAPLFDDLKTDSNAFAQDVFGFLGVERVALAPGLRRPANEASEPRSFAVAKLARRAGIAARDCGRPEWVTTVKSSRIVQRTLYRNYANGGKPQLDSSTRERLKDLFKEDVDALSELIGTDVAARWGY